MSSMKRMLLGVVMGGRGCAVVSSDGDDGLAS